MTYLAQAKCKHFSVKFIGRHVKGAKGPFNCARLRCKPVPVRSRAVKEAGMCIYRSSRPVLETQTQGSVEHLTTGCQSVSQAHPLSQRRKYCNCPAQSFLRDIHHPDITRFDSHKRFINLVPLKPIYREPCIKIRTCLRTLIDQ